MIKTTEFRTYRMEQHRGWGNSIAWFTPPDETGKGLIHGHLSERPRPGDRIICPMKSGRNAIFEVQAEGNSYPVDPPDQFFVNVAFAGYYEPEQRVQVRVEKPPVPDCGCTKNRAGDIPCHKCGEMVNVRCWKCGTVRGDGDCPSGKAAKA